MAFLGAKSPNPVWPLWSTDRERYVAKAMITPEGANDTRMGFNTFHMTKNFVHQILTLAKCLCMVVS